VSAGFNGFAELGTGDFFNRLTPTAVSGSNSFTQIDAGGRHTCGLLANGFALCWGEDCMAACVIAWLGVTG
jgi:hypothetical protein